VLLSGVLSIALFALSYPGKATTMSTADPMSCCQHDSPTSHQSDHKPGPFNSQGSPCCPGCTLAFGLAAAAQINLSISPDDRERVFTGQEHALVRTQRPPVPPPRSAAA